jgi:cation:H+ antiporter
VDLAILFIASLYGILLALLGRVSVIDGLLLIALYLFFLRRIGGTPGEPPAVVGVSAGLAALPRRQRHRWLVGLFALAAFVLAAVAVPFTDALQATGTELGISSFLLVQSIVPAATETPEFVVALALALNRRPGQGLAVFLAASVIQWTLALGLLPLTYLAGGGGPELPLDTRATVEVALTVATTLMAVAALASLRPKRIDSAIVLTLFAIQFAFPSTGVRVVVAVVLAMFALDILWRTADRCDRCSRPSGRGRGRASPRRRDPGLVAPQRGLDGAGELVHVSLGRVPRAHPPHDVCLLVPDVEGRLAGELVEQTVDRLAGQPHEDGVRLHRVDDLEPGQVAGGAG